MTPSITQAARATWARVESRDFDAVTDLRAALQEIAETGEWGQLDMVSEFDVGCWSVRVAELRSLIVLIEASRLEIFSIGRPGL